MKKITVLIAAFALLFATSAMAGSEKKTKSCKKQKSCCPKGNQKSNITLKTAADSVLYVIGADIGKNLKMSFDTVNMDVLVEAMYLGMSEVDTLFSDLEKQTIMMGFQQEMRTKQETKKMKQAAENEVINASFLAENKTKAGVKETASGLQYKVIKEGTGKSPLETDQVTVHYNGTLLDGTKFDSSYDRGQPATFPLNGVIPGWTEGVQLMKEGAVFEFYIKPDLGYGPEGSGPIPPNSILVFQVELISVGASE